MKNYVCRRCKSDNILVDAYAQWDVATQNYVITTVFDNATCVDCGGETQTEEINLTETKPKT